MQVMQDIHGGCTEKVSVLPKRNPARQEPKRQDSQNGRLM